MPEWWYDFAEQWTEALEWFAYGAALVLGLWTAAHAILRKRDPRSAALWIAVTLLLPLLGPLFYFLFGINRTRRRAHRRMARHRKRTRGGTGQARRTKLPDELQHLQPLVNLSDRILQEPLTGGNLIEPLFNGEETFPAMLAAIETSERSITCCSYIFDFDVIGKQFVEALASAHARGVEVKLLIDGVGGYWYFSKVRRALLERGLRSASFAPLGLLPTRLVHLNLRNHRKILVVDGRVGFTGGINISATQLADDKKNEGRFQDLHFRIRGPIVGQLQNTFADDWEFATGEHLKGEAYFPELKAEGHALARGVADGPDESLRKIAWITIGACQAARDSLRIISPYFIPDAAIKSAIVAAALRGVDVTLIVPERSDVRLVNWATTAYLWEFLEHGITVAYHAPPFHHTKLIVVDDGWVFLGSANLDPRSLRLNFEFNVEVYDLDLAAQMTMHIDRIAENGRRLTLAKVDGRPLPVRLRDGLAKLLSPYL